MESKTTRVLIMIFAIAGVAVLVMSLLIFPQTKYNARAYLLTACIWKLILDLLQASVISKRTFPEGISLYYRTSLTDLFAQTFVIGVVVLILIIDLPRPNLAFLLVINFARPYFIQPHYLKKALPLFILTKDKFIINQWFVREHELSGLRTIEFSGFFNTVSFAFQDRDFGLRRWGYTKAERAAFIREIIKRAPPDVFIHQDVRVFLDEHAPATA